MSAVAAARESRLPLVEEAPLVSIRELLLDSQNGLSKRQGHSGEPVPVLRLANVVDGAIEESDAREIRLTEKEIAKYALEPGDLLCIRVNGSRNLVGRIVPFTAQRRWAYCDHFIRLRPDRTRVDSRYLAHYLNTRAARRQIELSMVSSAGQNTVSQGTMLDLHVPLPALARQRAVVAELEKQFSRLDEAVTSLERAKANLKRYKGAVLKAAVEGRLVPTEAELASREGRSYETGTQLLAQVLQERRRSWNGTRSYCEPVAPVEGYLPSLPDGWALASLEALTSAVRVICYGILMPKQNTADGVLYVKVRDMKDDAIDLASLHRTSRAIAVKHARASLRAGDLLLSIRGTYGRVAQVPPALEGGNITQDTARIDVSRQLDVSFVAWFLRSEDAQRYFKTVARGVAVKGVNIGDVRPMAVPVPPLAEQHRIVAEVDRRLSIFREVEAEVDANLKRARALRQAVLASTFSVGSEHA